MREADGLPERDGVAVLDRYEKFDLAHLPPREKVERVLDQVVANAKPPVIRTDIEIADKTKLLQFEIFRLLRDVGKTESHQLDTGIGHRQTEIAGRILFQHLFGEYLGRLASSFERIVEFRVEIHELRPQFPGLEELIFSGFTYGNHANMYKPSRYLCQARIAGTGLSR